MKLTAKQLQMVQNCANAEELVAKAAEEGEDLTVAQAQKLIDSAAMIDIDENDLDMVSGGSDLPNDYFICSKCGKPFKKYKFMTLVCKECMAATIA